MALELKQQLKLSQQLVMTPQLQQAIRLLQLSRQELIDTVTSELAENPLLDVDETPDVALDQAAADTQPTDVDGPGEATAAEAQSTENDAAAEAAADGEYAPPGDGPLPDYGPVSTETDRREVERADTENKAADIDWDDYVENYNLIRSAPSNHDANEEQNSIEANMVRITSLADHLEWQIRMSDLSPDDQEVAAVIVHNLSEDGFLRGDTRDEDPLETVAQDTGATVEQMERVLARIQRFDPIGVAARTLEECLLVQIEVRGIQDPLIHDIVKRHLHHLELRNLQAIARDLHRSIEDITAAVKLITTLEPRPARNFSGEEPQYITPDIYVHKVGDKYAIVLNEDGMPKLKINSFYRRAVSAGSTGATAGAKDYVQERLRSATWLIRSIYQRQRTIYKVTESIVTRQRDFLDRGIQFLKPMILRDVAEDIGMHESTVSRVTTNKYVHTPQGIFELKYFFNNGLTRGNGVEDIASEAVKRRIKQMVEGEDSARPLSDQKIAQMLARENIEIARRTVAKYREMLGILPSSKRKRLF